MKKGFDMRYSIRHMVILVGLGNPGAKYIHSRHNMGFQVVERLGQALLLENWNEDKTCDSLVSRGEAAILVKPQTFMNLSGTAVKALLKKYDYANLGKKDFHSLFLIYDDLDLEVGKYKVVFGSRPKMHNGVNDVVEKLGTDQFWHIRIGVDGRGGDRSTDPQEYVLSGFRDDEQILIEKVVDSIVELLKAKNS